MAQQLFDFAVMTIFAREVLEGALIIGEYRTIILRGDSLKECIRRDDALRAVTSASLLATLLALVVIAAIAIPLGVLSRNFNNTTSNIIEGVSKIVAAICLLQLSLKMPKWLGVYGSVKRKKKSEGPERGDGGLTLRSIYFNVMWNIWREVAECGVFLIPFFLSGEGLIAIPLSAVIGTIVGLLLGLGIYYANKRLKSKVALTVFAVLVFVFLSAGLFAGGCHKLEKEIGTTKVVWQLNGDFWSVNRLPMTVLKPFGYNDTRTVLQIVCYWVWLALAALLHYRKYHLAKKIANETAQGEEDTTKVSFGDCRFVSTNSMVDTVEVGESSLEEEAISLPSVSARRKEMKTTEAEKFEETKEPEDETWGETCSEAC